MRLKTFNARDMTHAMELIRRDIGEDAIIISSTRAQGGKGVRVTAAIEQADEAPSITPFGAENAEANENGASVPRTAAEQLAHALQFHGTPAYLTEKILEVAASVEEESAIVILAQTLGQCFSFNRLEIGLGHGPVMLVGSPGAGKTVTCAKIAAEAVLNKVPVAMVTTDTKRAGGVEQLDAFADILDIDLFTADNPEHLQKILERCGNDHFVVVDTAAVNAHDINDLRALGSYISTTNIEPVLVAAAGTDSSEAADIASAFSYLGAQQMLVTKIDAARRFGSVLAAAGSSGLSFCHFSRTPGVADGLERCDATTLAALLLEYGGGRS